MFDIKNYKTFFIEQIHKMHKYLLASSIETIHAQRVYYEKRENF